VPPEAVQGLNCVLCGPWAEVLPHPTQTVRGIETRGGVHRQWVLQHELQHDVAAVEWRPMGGGMLAVACAAGLCLWDPAKGAPGHG
jgi:hypothetical protein